MKSENLPLNNLIKKLHFGVLFLLVGASSAHAGFYELSSGFSYSKTNYSAGSYTKSSRYGLSGGYNFNEFSSIEFSYQNIHTQNHITNTEDSTYKDQIYSINWAQNLMPKDYRVVPFIRLGAGQLNRSAKITDVLGREQQISQDTLTLLLGGGMRISFTKYFGLRIEGTSYLTNGKLRSWKDNYATQIGLSIYF